MDFLNETIEAAQKKYGSADLDNYWHIANYNNGLVLIKIEEDDDGSRGLKTEVTDMNVRVVDIDGNLDIFTTKDVFKEV